MNAWSDSLAGRWFVVADAASLARGPRSVTLLDRPIAVARLADGSLLALDDRCPHRQVPLSAGTVVGDTLRCAYHGWTFDRTGRCTGIPGMDPSSCPAAIRVPVVEAIEHDGLVWMRLRADESGTLPDFLTRLPAGSRRFLWTSTWQAGALDALENFLDPLHTHLVHPGLVRRHERRERVVVTVVRGDDGLTVDYDGAPQQTGLLYRLFESPRVRERAHFASAAAGTAQIEYRYRDGSALYFTLHFSPQHAAQTRVFGTLHVEGRWAPAWAVRLFVWPFLRRVAHQDRAMVELQAANLHRFGRRRGLSTALDVVRPTLEAVWSQGALVPESGTRVLDMWL